LRRRGRGGGLGALGAIARHQEVGDSGERDALGVVGIGRSLLLDGLFLVDDGLDPQAALDRPRFRLDGSNILLEEGLWERAADVESLGLRAVASRDRTRFGGGQAILVTDGGLVGGSDRRKDGNAAGL